jgi:IS30 family transposase
MPQVQRCSIEALLSMGMSRRSIAEKTGMSASTISREIARNSASVGYKSETAQEISLCRRSSASGIPKKMNGALKVLVLSGLMED